MYKKKAFIIFFISLFSCSYNNNDLPTNDGNKNSIDTQAVKHTESKICDSTVCDTINSYYISFKGEDTSWVKQIFPNITILMSKKKGTFSFGYWSCQSCRGTTYFEIRNINDTLITRGKFVYIGKRQSDNSGRSEVFNLVDLLKRKENTFQIYELDTLTNKRELITTFSLR